MGARVPETGEVVESRSAVPISAAAAAGGVAESRFDIPCPMAPNQDEEDDDKDLKWRHELAAMEAWCA